LLSKTSKQEIREKRNGVNKFRIYAYVVYFSIFFPKFAKSFTIIRYDEFLNKWKNSTDIENERQKLKRYLLNNISVQIFKSFGRLDESRK
jgi:hypothetical protein